MSGGHYDYLYSAINDLADRIEHDLMDEENFEGHADKVLEFYNHLRDVAECARELEWWMSADTDETRFLSKLARLK